MKREVTCSLILITLFMATMNWPIESVSSTSPANVIWSEEMQLTYDPSETYSEYDPETGKWINYTIVYEDYDALPYMTQTSDGRIWLVWHQDLTGNFEIFYKVYSRGWTNDTQLTDDPNIDIAPSILQASDGRIWVFWSSNRTGNNEIWYKTSTDNGETWSTDNQLTTDPRKDNNPAALQTSDGRIWLVWSRAMNSTNHDIYYKIFNGTSWSSDTQLTTDPLADQLPAITQTSDGRIWVFWSSNRTVEQWQIYYNTFDGSSWSGDTQLTTSTDYDSIDPTVFQAEDGIIWLFWASKEQTLYATYDIYFKTSADNGNTWSSTIQYTTHAEEDTWPFAIQAKDKSIWVAWTSTRADNVDIYYKVSLLGDINRDGSIDITDLVFIANALATDPSWPQGTGWNQWNPDCDLNVDEVVDVEDLFIAGKNFGSHA